ncbi:TMEM175 family protein [[Clostridium] aminophilum]|uniref:TMEM175 family protein n=1 Tax=[Clostridium] aminophilum TaxID=1526 RepID=UPI0033276665
MDKGRLEAFSDGVIAIIITITVLLIEPPKGNSLSDLMELMPLIKVYTVSFIMIGTNWANHHHLLKVSDGINGKVIWANHFYLFTLSFYPVATAWVGNSNFAKLPTISYVIVNLIESLAFILLEQTIINSHECRLIKTRIRKSHKELFTILLEVMALIFSFIDVLRFMSFILLLAMTALWIVPDLRFKQIIQGTEKNR